MDIQRSAPIGFLSHFLKMQHLLLAFFSAVTFRLYFITMNRRLYDHALTVLRMYMGGNAITTLYNAVSEPTSLVARTSNTFSGHLLVWILGVIGLAMIIDVIINDVMPQKFQWEKALKYRHFLFAALAASYISQLFVADMLGNGNAPTVTWVWHALMTMIASFVDAKKRSRDAGCAMLYN